MEKTQKVNNIIREEVGIKIDMLYRLSQPDNEQVNDHLVFLRKSFIKLQAIALDVEKSYEEDDFDSILYLDFPLYECEGIRLSFDALTGTSLIDDVDGDMLCILNDYYGVFNFMRLYVAYMFASAEIWAADKMINDCSMNDKKINHALAKLNIAKKRNMDVCSNIMIHDYINAERHLDMCHGFIDMAMKTVNHSVTDLYQ